MFDYNQLETLCLLEREGSLENTAKFKRVSKSALTQQTRNIDQSFGYPVVSRNPSSTTIKGSSLCKHVEIVKLMESALAIRHGHIFNTQAFDRAVLRISINDDLVSRSLLEHLLPKLRKQSHFPYEMIVARKSTAMDQVKNQSVSAAISSENDNTKGIKTYPLGNLPCVAVAAPNYFDVNFSDGFDLNATRSAHSASYDRTNDLNARFIRMLFDDEIGLPTFRLPSHYGVFNLCIDGVAWSVLPRHLVADDLQSGTLIDLCPGAILEVPIYWHVASYLDSLIVDASQSIFETTRWLITGQGDSRHL